ncbi:MAG: hypothetical protein Q8R76_09115 [Candidatus Omnitrophota bacterium]|nr:hypothetical protein [Candidatus Omnitrophota bacterium]
MISQAKRLFSLPSHLVTLKLSALLLILYPMNDLYVVMSVLGIILLVHDDLTKNHWVWLAAALAACYALISNWFSLNNHEFLIAYWCITCWLAASSNDPDKVLSWNARILVGLTFLFAELWKIFGGYFLDGSYLYYVFLAGGRFAGLASFIGDLTRETLAENRAAVDALKTLPVEGVGVALRGSPILKTWAIVFSYWTILIEAIIPIVYLSRRPALLHRYRSIPLLIFIATTYAIVPLHRFALVLNIFGFAQCPQDLAWIRGLHLLLFLLIPFF